MWEVCVCVNTPRQDSYKVAGAGGMKEGLDVPELTLKRLQLHPSADTQNLLDLHLAAKAQTQP